MDNNVIIKNDNNIMMAQERRRRSFSLVPPLPIVSVLHAKVFVLTYTQP